MTFSASSKLIQAISMVINQHSSLPLVSKLYLYNALHHYTLTMNYNIITQSEKITTLENKVSQLQTKLESIEKTKAPTIHEAKK